MHACGAHYYAFPIKPVFQYFVFLNQRKYQVWYPKLPKPTLKPGFHFLSSHPLYYIAIAITICTSSEKYLSWLLIGVGLSSELSLNAMGPIKWDWAQVFYNIGNHYSEYRVKNSLTPKARVKNLFFLAKLDFQDWKFSTTLAGIISLFFWQIYAQKRVIE